MCLVSGYENDQLSLLQQIPMSSWVAMTDETDSGIFHCIIGFGSCRNATVKFIHANFLFLVGILQLPSVDNGETLPDPLEHPPDDTEVGADLRAAATSRQEAPTGM